MRVLSKSNGDPTRLPVPVTSDGLRSARWSNARISWCAWRAEIPKILQSFREIFAQIMRDLDAGRLFVRIRTDFRLHQELQRRYHQYKTCAAHDAESTQFFCARRAEIPEILQNFRRILEQNLRHLDAVRLHFRVCTHD